MNQTRDLPLTDTTAACGCHEDEAVPELDVRAIPHRIRHATVFGALEAIGPGESLDLIAPHNPLPLLAQIADRENGQIAVAYLDEG
ncbi:MAG: DUF2249 domain-containing protein, partial [Nostocoides sp.]